MEDILTSDSDICDALGATDEGDIKGILLEVEETVLEVEETPRGTEDDCEGEGVGRRRLWRFLSGSPVTEPDSLSIVEMILKLNEERYRLYNLHSWTRGC